jgi:uncharacterized protein YjbI with pentapeptide repeats
MANKEHLKILEQGVDFWNQWRKNNPKIIPDLSRSLLHKENLSDAYLAETNLIGSNLSDAIFKGTNLRNANLTDADLSYADIKWATFRS